MEDEADDLLGERKILGTSASEETCVQSEEGRCCRFDHAVTPGTGSPSSPIHAASSYVERGVVQWQEQRRYIPK